MEKNGLIKIITVMIVMIGLASCSSVSSPTHQASNTHTSPSAAHNTALWGGNPDAVWNKLQRIPPSKLAVMQSQTSDPVANAWINLALISKRNSVNTQQLAQQLMGWRERNPTHPANQLLPDTETLNQLQTIPQPRQIALLLPLHGTYASSGQTVREGFLNAYYVNLAKVGKQNVKFYDTTQAHNIDALYQQAIAEGADFVIGPLLKENVQQLNQTPLPTPTLALNYTDMRRGSLPTNLYQFGLLPEDETAQIAHRARDANLSRALIIAPQTSAGKRLASAFSASWRSLGGNIQETLYYSANADFNQDIARLLKVNQNLDKKLAKEKSNKQTLEQQRRHDFDVIFLFSQSQEAHVIIPLLRYYYVNDIPVFAISSIYTGNPNQIKDADLNNVIVCDIPWGKNISTDRASSNRLYAVGQDAYLLSQTLQRLTQLPHFPIYGSTGALTLSSNQQIHRRLPCRPVQNGSL